MTSNTRDRSAEADADRVTVSYPAGAGDRVRSELEADSYRGYLRKTRAGAVAVGDEWAEFVSRGCGSTRDVVLRVEAVEGGGRVGERTELAFEPRSEEDG